VVVVVSYPFFRTAQLNLLIESIWTSENNFKLKSKKNFLGSFDPAALVEEVVSYLRGAMRAISSLGCEGATRANSWKVNRFKGQGFLYI
jgi:hypothetical protein